MVDTRSKPTGARSRGKRKGKSDSAGKLKIGDDWNAIRIIALSQSNPLKAIAEFVENSIDANAAQITITRFRQQKQAYIRIEDDGDGVPLDEQGQPNFHYVATHICDSIKRQIKAQGQTGIQGEFGIGLLSFWTVGETLSMICPGSDGKPYEMRMVKGDPKFEVSSRRVLTSNSGTKLTVGPLLPGIRNMSGEKLQWYLASELRDRIRKSKVNIRVVDRMARAEYAVEPREFDGQLLNHLPLIKSAQGDVYAEIYLAEPNPERKISLFRSGTRVLSKISDLDVFQKPPWTSNYFAGVLDAPFLNLTPGSRLGLIHDEQLQAFVESLSELETMLLDIADAQQRMANEKVNRDTLKSIQKAFREALMILPEEEYDWFDIQTASGKKPTRRPRRPESAQSESEGYQSTQSTEQIREAAYIDSESGAETDSEPNQAQQTKFYEFPGPLANARITPSSCAMSVESVKTFQAVARDRNRRLVSDRLHYEWKLVEGSAEFDFSGSEDGATVSLTAPAEPQLLKLALTVTQQNQTHSGNPSTSDGGHDDQTPDTMSELNISATAEAIITVTDSLLPAVNQASPRRGLPEYTFEKQPGQLWRSRFDTEANLIVINSGHRDFVFAAGKKALKLRYICRLFGKELVLQNFPGLSAEQLIERVIELGLYTEENLR